MKILRRLKIWRELKQLEARARETPSPSTFVDLGQESVAAHWRREVEGWLQEAKAALDEAIARSAVARVRRLPFHDDIPRLRISNYYKTLLQSGAASASQESKNYITDLPDLVGEVANLMEVG